MDAKPSTRSIWIPVLVAALLMAGGAGWRVWQGLAHRTQQAPAPPAETTAASPPSAPSMPSMQQADDAVRLAAEGLSASPKFREWLGVGDLARKFVATVNNIADGASPRVILAFLAPVLPFKTEKRQGKAYIDPSSYARYDEVAAVIASIDAKAAAGAYQRLHPLLSAAYGEIGKPGTTLDGRLQDAIQRLVTTPELPDMVEVHAAPVGVAWEFADPRLEGMSPASKHLLRMGARNEKLIQSKLREIGSELHLSPVAATQEEGPHHPG